MIIDRHELFSQADKIIAVCGHRVQGDAFHVGLAFRFENDEKIVHFINGDNIHFRELNDSKFANYKFNIIEDFPEEFIPSLLALAELIANNKVNGFTFNKIGTFYDGGKFEHVNGSFTGKSGAEKFINCGVFVYLLLSTYDYYVLDWNTWPNVKQVDFLNAWLDQNQIPINLRAQYYQNTKEVRGKHILVCPDAASVPPSYADVEPLALLLVNNLNY